MKMVIFMILKTKDIESQVNHKDGNKKNNNVDNLEWCTLKENMQHTWNNGLCKNSSPCGDEAHHRKNNSEIVKNILLDLENGMSYQQIADEYNISKSTVYQINHRITWNNEQQQ